MRSGNLSHILSDALTTEWMMTLEACQALQRIYLDALSRKGEIGHLQWTDIQHLWAQHENEGLSEKMHMMRDEDSVIAAQTVPLKDTSYTSVYKNVAIIDVIGPIVPRVRGMSSGSVGAQQIKNDFITAFEDDNIKAILFNVDSPGGDARGISELSQTIKKARDKNTKLIHAYASGWMASAAYFIASPVHRIVVNDWASVGSIGVVIGVPPKMEGDNIEFVSTIAPYKRPDVSTDEGKQVYQGKADYMGQLFIKAVAQNRGVTEEKVIADFGKGGTLIGKQAVAAGLGDAIGTFDSALHALITSKPLGSLSTSNSGDNAMSTQVAKKKWFQSLKERLPSFGAAERQVVEAALKDAEAETDSDAGSLLAPPANDPPAASTQQPPAQSANNGNGNSTSAAENEELKSMRERLERAEARIESEQAAARAKDAEAFAGSMVIAGKILPAAKEAMTALYLQNANDDAANPLASGSRVETFQSFTAGLPAHTLTQELTRTDLPPGSSVLNPDKGSNEERLAADEEGSREYARRHNPRGNLQSV